MQKGGGSVSRRRGEDNSQGSGILRFYEEDSPGFQIGPTTVLACSVIFIGLVVILHIVGKFSS
jgi:protein transport protein SEC61 subunit beta